MKYEKCNVVMLSTEKASQISQHREHKDFNLLSDRNYPYAGSNAIFENQFLYITSKEEIKLGDAVIFRNTDHSSLGFAVKEFDELCIKVPGKIGMGGLTFPFPRNFEDRCSKVIASTDPSLVTSRPSQEFLQVFCNTDNIIEEVLVEYTEVLSDPDLHDTVTVLKLKVAPDNTITIKPVKYDYTKETLKQLCESAYNAGRNMAAPAQSTMGHGYTFEQWFKANV